MRPCEARFACALATETTSSARNPPAPMRRFQLTATAFCGGRLWFHTRYRPPIGSLPPTEGIMAGFSAAAALDATLPAFLLHDMFARRLGMRAEDQSGRPRSDCSLPASSRRREGEGGVWAARGVASAEQCCNSPSPLLHLSTAAQHTFIATHAAYPTTIPRCE